MRTLPAFMPILSSVLVFLTPGMPAKLAEAESKSRPTSTANAPDITAAATPLLGKWSVRSVQHDASPTAAQIGRKAGDIIEFARGADGNIGLT